MRPGRCGTGGDSATGFRGGRVGRRLPPPTPRCCRSGALYGGVGRPMMRQIAAQFSFKKEPPASRRRRRRQRAPHVRCTARSRRERRCGALLKRHHLKIVDFELYRRRRLGRPCRGGGSSVRGGQVGGRVQPDPTLPVPQRPGGLTRKPLVRTSVRAALQSAAGRAAEPHQQQSGSGRVRPPHP